ncbi:MULTISPECIES: NAD(P)-dependent alcohol dehydrogenase [unclassified Microbacterium]|uniref:NAD(P)-dependent alcohol dehydrogenase n=1 Tax=unclassified Microbacterium TaxID=2609290 RepID=UPI00214C085C|nr:MULTISPECIES: NAD(P)-dependent alcohol dehydrogenase [unclassified Microbacterium]MCR2809351.1 NAD(P)-dependent alcohol dehydrogenase [Microbacterium sp. zg.B185]WIM20490.1 NAD(P)-dependent alcohol dehydrogenase [Microbacterium sp. zg-B185]
MTTHASAETTALPTAMTVWSQHRYGDADAVAPEDVPVPSPGPHEVLVRVHATGLNSADARVMRGDPLILRLAFGLRRPRAAVQGRDIAGTVVGAGAAVTTLQVGDAVLGETTGGGLAPFVVVPAARLVRRPEGLDDVVAATLPMAGGTAWQALALAGIDDAAARGARVLIIGAGGGVGHFTVQLAALRGAEVTALAGPRALAMVTALGASSALEHRRTDLSQLAAASFAVVVIAGDHPLRQLRRLVVPGGTVVLVSGGSRPVIGPLAVIARAMVLSVFGSRRLRPLVATAKPEITAELARLAAAGEITPHIERVWPLAHARAALAHIDAAHTVGKVVVRGI